MDCSPPGSYIHGIFQARVLEWGAIAFSVESLGLSIYNITLHASVTVLSLAFQFGELNLVFLFIIISIFLGEGNGNPLKCSFLENPRDGGAWWTAVYGVAQSRTRLSDFTFTFSLSCIGEENGNPLKCSCLENPRDGGAWWADVYGVTQSQTRLK